MNLFFRAEYTIPLFYGARRLFLEFGRTVFQFSARDKCLTIFLGSRTRGGSVIEGLQQQVAATGAEPTRLLKNRILDEFNTQMSYPLVIFVFSDFKMV